MVRLENAADGRAQAPKASLPPTGIDRWCAERGGRINNAVGPENWRRSRDINLFASLITPDWTMIRDAIQFSVAEKAPTSA